MFGGEQNSSSVLLVVEQTRTADCVRDDDELIRVLEAALARSQLLYLHCAAPLPRPTCECKAVHAKTKPRRIDGGRGGAVVEVEKEMV